MCFSQKSRYGRAWMLQVRQVRPNKKWSQLIDSWSGWVGGCWECKRWSCWQVLWSVSLCLLYLYLSFVVSFYISGRDTFVRNVDINHWVLVYFLLEEFYVYFRASTPLRTPKKLRIFSPGVPFLRLKTNIRAIQDDSSFLRNMARSVSHSL